ncbi:MAG: flap endonuclease-1 [Nitrososphaerota archaeon]|nr:flap endonuclease-1 [Candidatus Bathyarchaeota archaeon]MCX8161618.1 flap endonuclease-1 [Candidatus Bathyarchaeota archaeon]MDW8061832.1 flap endonuclease-1 [Nitrososphaerota archaeon]
MGVNLGDIIPRRVVGWDTLKGKVLAIDAYNALYQFLATIRGPRGEPLKDSEGRVTSHLSGLLYRTARFLESGIKPVYVFDGVPPALKEAEIKRRRTIREEAIVRYEEALSRGDYEAARRYAQASATLKDYMAEDAKRLLKLIGIPYVEAPSEGEAQAAWMTIRGDAWAAVSQDHDALLFGAMRVVRNLSVVGRRKLPGKDVYVEVEPELITLDEVLSTLNLSREQLIDIAILVGTDYYPEGVKGIGPKKALDYVKRYNDAKSVLRILGIQQQIPVDEIRKIFLEPQVRSDYKLEWRQPDVRGVVDFLCGERDFNKDRVVKAVSTIAENLKTIGRSRTLEGWFR